MKFYIDDCEVSEKVFDVFVRLEALMYDEKDTNKYLNETKEQLIKYEDGIYNGITKITLKIKQ